MPSIKDINVALEKKVDLSSFFGEEAFVTIKKMGKYNFSFLLNKGRTGYTSKLYSLIIEWKEQNADYLKDHPEVKNLPDGVYDKLKMSISTEETDDRMKIESEIDKSYYDYSIKKDGHNFTDGEGKLLEIIGEWFFDNFSGLSDSEGRNLNDVMINEIISFNHKGIVLGESIASK